MGRFPPSGIEPERLQAQIEALLRLGPGARGASRRLAPLPGLQIVRGHAFYAGQWLGKVSSEVQAAWSALTTDEPEAEASPAALVEQGFAIMGAPRVDAAEFSVVVAPHCDDAALGLGGTLAARLDAEHPVVVEVFTVSNWLGDGLRPRPPEQVTTLRRREEQTSTALLGAHMLGLGFWDVDCRTLQRAACEDYPIPDDFRWELDPALRPVEELEAIRTALRTIATHLAPRRIYLPLGLGGQSDHRLVASIGESMLPWLDETTAEIIFYEDQPYAAKAGCDQVEAEARARGLEPAIIDVADTFERKMQAIAVHRSQFKREAIEVQLRAYAAALGADHPVERIWRRAA